MEGCPRLDETGKCSDYGGSLPRMQRGQAVCRIARLWRQHVRERPGLGHIYCNVRTRHLAELLVSGVALVQPCWQERTYPQHQVGIKHVVAQICLLSGFKEPVGSRISFSRGAWAMAACGSLPPEVLAPVLESLGTSLASTLPCCRSLAAAAEQGVGGEMGRTVSAGALPGRLVSICEGGGAAFRPLTFCTTTPSPAEFGQVRQQLGQGAIGGSPQAQDTDATRQTAWACRKLRM